MELREVMQKRKSIRQYLTTPVEEEKVKAMIEAAILAPTWKNAQEIRYYVAVSEETRQRVRRLLKEKKYFESVRQYTGEILLVGINYDKKTKKHQCMIEKVYI